MSTLRDAARSGSRWAYYDAVGAVRDVVQNHLLQVLAYVTTVGAEKQACSC